MTMTMIEARAGHNPAGSARESDVFLRAGRFVMKRFLSILTATVLASAFALPLNAAPISVQKPGLVRADVLHKVDDDDDDRRKWRRKHYRNWRAERHWKRRHASRYCRYDDRCYPRRYYGRSYGHREYYPRYRHRPGVSIYLEF
jgi:Ni/Co efflux regulator RcnB